MPNQTKKGVVKWFSIDRGYGYIVGKDNVDRHFGVTDVVGATLPQIGQQVHFLPVQNSRGAGATSVELIDKSSDKGVGDGRIICEGCNNRVNPRIVINRGETERSVCPVCGATIRRFMALELSWSQMLWGDLVSAITFIEQLFRKKK